ncbi:MAG: type I secretion C-terminal target domain-containing protein [Proteobacteria bacterium]|nr:type I secretion C-terminal target domain-containing protein [Pseudomonadota bacterium]
MARKKNDFDTSTLTPAPTLTPSDTHFGLQWHLKNTGQNGGTAGIDIDVTRVWDDYKGAGIKVAIIDDGFDLTHADLAANFNTTTDYDFRRNDATPMFETGDAHGTAVAGTIGADDNGLGMVGVAPDAQMSGLRVSFSSDSTLAMFENAMIAARNFDVVNNSWGFTGRFADNFTQSYMATMENAVLDAVEFGRGGLGTNIVFAAGNGAASGDNVNYHSMQNSSFIISVGAVDKTGQIASFSTPGAAVLVSAPGVEIYTTDNTGTAGYLTGDYVGIGGTSFAAPIVSGVIALMLDANETLGYRDVQEILAYSAKKIDAANTGWQTNGAENFNGGGLHYSHNYGFGMVDAHTAVRLAETWGQGQGTFATLDVVTASNLTAVTIPDGTSFASSTITITQDMLVDRVEIALNISHSMASQLDVVLVSPHGTQSLLVDNVSVSTLPSFVFNTVANWGESAAGDWTLKVYDRTGGTQGALLGWAIQILGDTPNADDKYIFTDEFAALATTAHEINDNDGGTDTLNAAALSNAVILDMTARTGTIGGRTVTIAADTSLETVFTGDGADAITGDAANNIINTGRGNDMVFASKGIDVARGGAGLDTFVFSGFVDNTLTVNTPNHVTIAAKTTTDKTDLFDFEFFQIGSDVYNLANLITLYETPVTIPGLTIIGNGGAQTLNGGDGNDTIDAKGGNDIVNALAGNDTVWGGTGTDRIYGGVGLDTLYGDDGNDSIWGGLDHDIINGGAGNDLLYGEEGNDTIIGGLGSDTMNGGLGNDTMTGGIGLDKFYGGTGNDTFVLDAADASMDRIYEFQATGPDSDKLDISALLIGYDTTDPIANFLRLTVSGADTSIRINNDGIGNDFVTVARIYGANLSDTAQNYINNGVIIAD